MKLDATRLVLAVLVLGVLLAPGPEAAAQKRPVRLGELNPSWGPTPFMVGLRDGLVELGYRENKDFVIGVRFTQGDIAGLDAAARQLIRTGVDIIVATAGSSAAEAAQRATSEIPIIFGGAVGNPVELGLVRSIAAPGGNITGVTDLAIELGPKRLELFREIVPGLKRVLFVYDPTERDTAAAAAQYRDAAQRLGITLVERPVRNREEARKALAGLQQARIDGVLVPPGLSLNLPGLIVEAARTHRVPTMFEAEFWIEQGALAAYGPDHHESGRQAARMVDKILKGARPADIPVETNQKIEFAVNLKVAEMLGLALPPHIVLRANKLVR